MRTHSSIGAGPGNGVGTGSCVLVIAGSIARTGQPSHIAAGDPPIEHRDGIENLT